MGEYYIIAAGGTGAMCARSFIYMAAAGCADNNSKYHILLMDKDKESDAMTACENLLADYQVMRAQLATKADTTYTFPEIVVHKWNFTDEIVDEYRKQTGKPASDLTNLTLNKLLNPNEDSQINRLLVTMYSNEELNTDLNKGFYGHPNIGAPVFDYVRDRFLATRVENADRSVVDNTFMQSLHATLKNGPAHVYLFGSLFGGTGATVLPNVALALRSLRNPDVSADCYGQNRLVLGGSVIMPYFKLPSCPPDSKEVLQNVVPIDAKFEGQTKEALAYYHESGLLSNMMNLLLVGTSKLDVTSEIFARGGSQTQHFHVVLMIAAAAANRFFADKLGNMASAYNNNTVSPLGELLLWKITPNDPNNSGAYHSLTPMELGLEEEYARLTTFLRFSVVVAYYMRLKFNKPERELMEDVEIQGTVRQMRHNGRPIDPNHISRDEITACYKEPVANAGAICRGFIRYMFDVALSGFDWSKYRELKRSNNPVTVEGKDYYDYTLGQIDRTAPQHFVDRWLDFANITALKSILEADSPDQILSNMSLNSILSYSMKDPERTPYSVDKFPNSIATVYEKDTLSALGLEKNFFGKMKRTDVWFCEIYEQLYKKCIHV